MDEKMLIDAMRQVVQEEIKKNNETLRDELRAEMSEMMDTKLAGSEARMDMRLADTEARLDAKLDGLKVEVSDMMDTKLADTEARLDEKIEAVKHEIMHDFHIVIEDKVSKEIRLIAEQHGDLVRKQQEFERVEERTADLEDRMQVIEVVVKKHTGEIQELQRA